MIEIKLITLCDYASISREGKLNINGVFDEFRTDKLPGVLVRGFLVATFECEPNTRYRLKIKLTEDVSGDSQTIGEVDNLTGSSGKHNLVAEIVGAPFPKEGQYSFRIFHGDDELGSVSLKVIHHKEAQKENFKLAN